MMSGVVYTVYMLVTHAPSPPPPTTEQHPPPHTHTQARTRRGRLHQQLCIDGILLEARRKGRHVAALRHKEARGVVAGGGEGGQVLGGGGGYIRLDLDDG